jgi:cbb3-type cytochrome oxidase subunit 3
MGYEMLIIWATKIGLLIWAIIALACIWAINFPRKATCNHEWEALHGSCGEYSQPV